MDWFVSCRNLHKNYRNLGPRTMVFSWTLAFWAPRGHGMRRVMRGQPVWWEIHHHVMGKPIFWGYSYNWSYNLPVQSTTSIYIYVYYSYKLVYMNSINQRNNIVIVIGVILHQLSYRLGPHIVWNYNLLLIFSKVHRRLAVPWAMAQGMQHDGSWNYDMALTAPKISEPGLGKLILCVTICFLVNSINQYSSMSLIIQVQVSLILIMTCW